MRGTGGGSGRWLAGALACCVTALLGVVGTIGVPAVASAGTGTSSLASAPSSGSAPSLATAGGRGASAPLGSALVIAGSPTQGEQVQAGAAARWASPQARVAREKSRTAFERLNAGTAAKLARAAFPGVVDDRAGGPPQLPAGQKIVGYPTDKVAQVELGGGKHAVIESMQPLALEGTNGPRGRSAADGHGRVAHAGRRVGRAAGWLGRHGRWGERAVREHAGGYRFAGQADDGWIRRGYVAALSGEPTAAVLPSWVPGGRKPCPCEGWVRRCAGDGRGHGDRGHIAAQRSGCRGHAGAFVDERVGEHGDIDG